MLCFRDMTFCESSCANTECSRYWDAEKSAAADRWWGKEGAPIAFSDFAPTCVDHIEPKLVQSKEL